ncbi:hypothetical protein HDU93_005362, partial [Gonapodya sp. JEL0774]
EDRQAFGIIINDGAESEGDDDDEEGANEGEAETLMGAPGGERRTMLFNAYGDPDIDAMALREFATFTRQTSTPGRDLNREMVFQNPLLSDPYALPSQGHVNDARARGNANRSTNPFGLPIDLTNPFQLLEQLLSRGGLVYDGLRVAPSGTGVEAGGTRRILLGTAQNGTPQSEVARPAGSALEGGSSMFAALSSIERWKLEARMLFGPSYGDKSLFILDSLVRRLEPAAKLVHEQALAEEERRVAREKESAEKARLEQQEEKDRLEREVSTLHSDIPKEQTDPATETTDKSVVASAEQSNDKDMAEGTGERTEQTQAANNSEAIPVHTIDTSAVAETTITDSSSGGDGAPVLMAATGIEGSVDAPAEELPVQVVADQSAESAPAPDERVMILVRGREVDITGM